jgi:hypothetical protein
LAEHEDKAVKTALSFLDVKRPIIELDKRATKMYNVCTSYERSYYYDEYIFYYFEW